jgi:hypothetical protein
VVLWRWTSYRTAAAGLRDNLPDNILQSIFAVASCRRLLRV